ncbi:MAG TPA: 16S rRNA (cytosine(1402)-N(4))-methyltransferase RsmH [Kofleriaceae bacterium]
MDFAHESVLVGEVIEYLNPRDGGLYVDGTAGGGGHLSAVLSVPGTRAIGIDRDATARDAAAKRLESFGDRVTILAGRYSEMPQLIDQQVDGILLDIGVSSPQLDRAERGFSFMKEGPLDMRMDPTSGRSAAELIDETDADSLAEIIRELGEERHARKIANAIKEAKPTTTTELAKIISAQIPMREQRQSTIHPATRTFQALRIAVNQELAELETFLGAFADLLKPGGRCVVISFHSLEDRLVKNAFRDLEWTTSLPERYAREQGERVHPVVEVLTKKPVFATDAEAERNPRARSARLRACQRTDAPNVPALASGS